MPKAASNANKLDYIDPQTTNIMKKTILFSMLSAAATVLPAQNPIVQTWFTPDPAPMVHDGTL